MVLTFQICAHKLDVLVTTPSVFLRHASKEISDEDQAEDSSLQGCYTVS